jgi:hypothetical protein
MLVPFQLDGTKHKILLDRLSRIFAPPTLWEQSVGTALVAGSRKLKAGEERDPDTARGFLLAVG